MSHSTTDASWQPADHLSWVSLLTSDAFDDVSDVRQGAQNKEIPVSRPQSQNTNDRETISRGTSSLQLAHENEALLNTNQARPRHPSISSTTNRSSLDRTPRLVALNEPGHRATLTCTKSYRLSSIFLLTSQQWMSTRQELLRLPHGYHTAYGHQFLCHWPRYRWFLQSF